MSTITRTGLTTIFTPPPACSSSWTYEQEFYNSVPGGLLLQNALSVTVDTKCFPPGFGYIGRVPFPTEVYSPGACPGGYATATLSFNGDTTLGVCCQSGFSYTSLFSEKNQFNTTTVLFAGCTSMYSAEYGSTVVPARNEQDLNITTVTGPLIMWGQPISIEFQQKVLTLFTTGTATDTSTGAATAQPSLTAAQSTPGSTGSSLPSPSPSPGLSTGAKAGIGVAVAVCALAILLAVGFIFVRRRKMRKSLGGHAVADDDDDNNSHQWQRKELDGSPYRRELAGSMSPPPTQELAGSLTIEPERKYAQARTSRRVELE